MSNFISSIPPAGLMEMPPVSNVTALPTRPSTSGARPFAGGVYRITIIRGGCAEPCATASIDPAPIFSRRARSSTVTFRPWMPSASPRA